MSFDKNKLAAALAAAILVAIEGIAGDSAAGTTSTTAGNKGGRGNKATKETPPEDDGLGGLGGEDDDGLGGLGGEEEEEQPTKEEVVAAFKALKASHGVPACQAVLKALKESNVLNIPEDKYADAIAQLTAASKKKK